MMPPGTMGIEIHGPPGRYTGYPLPRSHYDRVGMYYKWTYADPGGAWKQTAWQWVESPPMFASGALTGLFYDVSGNGWGHPDDECQTAETGWVGNPE